MKKTLKLCMTGFGAVAQRFCQLLQEKKCFIRDNFGYEFLLTGISTPSRGTLIDLKGLDFGFLFEIETKKGGFPQNHPGYRPFNPIQMIQECQADCLVELSTLSIRDGEPAASYIESAFEHKLHVITANKGPEAWKYHELQKKADEAGRQFLFETIVLDGTPSFNLVRDTLHGNQILGIRGILNGTSNYVLGRLEDGLSYEEAVKEAQALQIAEADPSLDLDGWDGAAKICAMANILMDAHMNPNEVSATSIRSVTRKALLEAKENGKSIKYICEAVRDSAGTIKLSVSPKLISKVDPFSHVNGTSAAFTLYTDLAGELTIIQSNPGILQTAYGVYSDLLTLLKRIS